jgi:RimJ/RimL family protein N-acetyltransferase
MFRTNPAEETTMTQRLNEFGQPIGPALDGWAPRPLPPDTPMIGQYCRIERLNAERHVAGLFTAYSLMQDDRDWTYLPGERPITLEAHKKHLREREDLRDPLYHVIIDPISRDPLGESAYMRIDAANGVIEIGHVRYSRRLMRTRAGTEAMYLFMRRVFDELGYRRYEWKCDALNSASRRAAERYGFTFEGIFRQAIVVKGRSRDTAWFSILDSEWPRVRNAFETWLAPDNFDANGKQRRSLADLRQPPITSI